MNTTASSSTRFRISGERMLIAVYGEGIDPAINERVRRMAALVDGLGHPAIEAVIPAYCTLALTYNPLCIHAGALTRLLLGLEAHLDQADIPAGATVEIPVYYGGAFGPDLDAVARHTGLSSEEVVRLHAAGTYRIYALGFAPGFCYLGGLDPRLHTPRLETPRVRVAAGSVGIAGAQTGVYPLASPGGWRLIGRTPLRLFAPERPRPVPYQAGDQLRFRPITVEAFEHLHREDQP